MKALTLPCPTAGAILWLALLTGAHAQVSFPGGQEYLVGDRADWVLAADANGDGLVDILTTNRAADTVSLILQKGDGGFRETQFLAVGDEPRWVAVGDLNKDGNPDIVTGNNGSDDVTVLFGDGTGAFPTRLDLTTQNDPAAVIIVDLDEDDNLDLAVACNAYVSILLGDGAGGFDPQQPYESNARNFAMGVGDFNEDDDLDLVVGGSSHVSVLRGDGLGGFSEGLTTAVGGFGVESLAVGDFDHDDHLDVAVAAEHPDLFVLFGDGTGLFPDDDAFRTASPDEVAAVSAVDFDEDGHLDLIAAAPYYYDGPVYTRGNNVWFLPGDGMRGFGPPVLIFVPPVPQRLDCADVDGDGHLDILTLTQPDPRFEESVCVTFGDGSGDVKTPVKYTVGTGPDSIVIGRFDGDEHPDLAVAVKDMVRLMLGDGNGGFTDGGTSFLGRDDSCMTGGDFNKDGNLDLVTAHKGAHAFSIMLGDGAGGIGTPQFISMGRNPTALVVEDFNRDDSLDVATTSEEENTVSVRFGDGAGGFGDVATYAVGAAPSYVVAGQFDGNDAVDLAVTNYGDDRISILLGDGTGGFLPAVNYPTVENPRHLLAIDLDEDTHLDLVVSHNHIGYPLAVQFGNGDGTFGAYVELSHVSHPSYAAAGDVDEDGDQDLIVAGNVFDEIAVFLGNGRGRVAPPLRYVVGNGPSLVVVEDLNGDGHQDFVTSVNKDGQIAISLNETFDPARCRSGNVDATLGAPENVLFLNGSPGTGDDRVVVVGEDDPFLMRMEQPPSATGGSTKYTLYAWARTPSTSTVRTLPFELGGSCMPTPLSIGGPQPKKLVNQIGKEPHLGTEDWPQPTGKAPWDVLDFPGGIGKTGSFFFQGIILNNAAPNGVGAVTNGLEVQVQ